MVVPVDSAPTTITRRASQARAPGPSRSQCATGSARIAVPETGTRVRSGSTSTACAWNRRASSAPYASEEKTASTRSVPAAARKTVMCSSQTAGSA